MVGRKEAVMNHFGIKGMPEAEIHAAGEGSVRDRLLHVAADVFARKGYAATSVNEIVEAAGVTKPVLYYYFENKAGIFQEIFVEARRQFHEALRAPQDPNLPVITRLMDLCGRVYDLYSSHLEIARLFHSIYYGPPQGAPPMDLEQFHMPFQEAIARLVEEGVQTGEFRPESPEDILFAVMGPVSMSMDIQLCHPEMAPGRAGLVRILGLICRGIAATDTETKGVQS
jgi:TetR/AcrR family transcriptional regulator